MASSSSTSSSEDRRLRPLGLGAFALVLAGTFASLELGVGLAYDAPSPMVDKASEYAATTDGSTRDVLVVGTCLAEQIIDPTQLARQLGSDVTVHDLSTPAGSVLLWTLALKNYVPEDADVALVLLPYGDSDLRTRMNPWESQVMDLAGWGDLPMLADLTCEDASCVSELILRKASRAFRYRGYLANWIWHALGTKSLSRVAGQDALTQAREGGRQLEPSSEPGGATQGLGWTGGRRAQQSSGEEAIRFEDLQVLLDLAQQRGWPLLFTDLPMRPDPRDPYWLRQRANARKSTSAFVESRGASHRSLEEVPGLERDHFTDEVHVSMEGGRLITTQLARLARQVLGQGDDGE